MERTDAIDLRVEVLLDAFADDSILILNLLYEPVHLLKIRVCASLMPIYLVLHANAGGVNGNSPHQKHVDRVDGG